MCKFSLDFDLSKKQLYSEDIFHLRKSILKLKNELEDFFFKKDNNYNLTNKLQGLVEVTNGAFGYCFNPYRNIPNYLKEIIDSLNHLLSTIYHEDTCFMHVEIALVEKENKRRKKNLLNRDYFIPQSFLNTMTKLSETIELYNALNNNKLDIFLKYMGYRSDYKIQHINNEIIINKENDDKITVLASNNHNDIFQIKVIEKINNKDYFLKIITYSMQDSLWGIWESSDYINDDNINTFNDSPGLIEYFKKHYPEKLLKI